MAQLDPIAYRDLLFSRKDASSRIKLRVYIKAPVLVDRTSTGVPLDVGSAVCTLVFDGLGVDDVQVHGVDTLHAVAQAVEIDKYLRGMTKKFDFFWPSGEPYFDDDSSK